MNIHSDFSNAVSPDELQMLEKTCAEDRILWALRKHNEGLSLTSSFGIQAAVLLHMVSQLAPETLIIDIDTQHKHLETYRYKRDLIEHLGLKVITYRADMSAREQEALYGQQWKDGLASDQYKWTNKVEPMERAIAENGITCWISGLRREQKSSRENLPVAEQKKGVEKIYPLIDWTEAQVTDYMNEFNLPFHPLAWEGYRTIGDYFEHPEIRAECGLHAGFDPKI